MFEYYYNVKCPQNLYLADSELGEYESSPYIQKHGLSFTSNPKKAKNFTLRELAQCDFGLSGYTLEYSHSISFDLNL